MTRFLVIKHRGWMAAALSTLWVSGGGCAADSAIGKLPRMKEIPVALVRPVWDQNAHPFVGAAAIDVDGNDKFEVFVGGTQNQPDVLLSDENGALVNREPGTGLSKPNATTYGVTAIDMDGDGRTDLVVARNDGVSVYLNKGNRHFEERKIPLQLPSHGVPFQASVADIDHDGFPDLYISNFVEFASFRSATYNDPSHAKLNIMLHNNGDMTFRDITASSGTAGTQNTFTSAFVDLDNDGWQDLVVANNTGEVEIFRNLHNLTFEKVASVSKLGFWMGLAIGDIDKDGRQDLFFPNVGHSIPEFLTRGDLRSGQEHTHDWLLLHNNGDFQFKDVTQQYGLDDEGFGWGGVLEDIGSTGDLNLLVAENYIKWPIHKWFKLRGRAFGLVAEKGQLKYRDLPELGLANEHYGQSCVIVDLDGDGRQDFMWINMEGPTRAFLNQSKGNYLTIKVPTDVRYLGARIRLDLPDGSSYTREVISNQGFMTGQNPEYSFGLGSQTRVTQVVIHMPDGKTRFIKNPAINQKISLD
jgi:enediyne biosynthesis protein E4